MSELVDLKKIERKSYLAYLQDGVLRVAGAWGAIILPMGWAIKSRLNHPRPGFIISGAILTLADIVLMIRFLRRYPKSTREETIA